MRTKKYIKRELPCDTYEIIDTYSLGEDDYLVCENCLKVIKNIAIVRDSKGRTYNVGMDCAETLSGITEDDILFWNDNFMTAKIIRAKIRKYKKEGAIIRVQNMPGERDLYIDILKTEDPEILRDWYWYRKVSAEFIKKYLPELYKIARVNYDFIPTNKNEFQLVDGMYDGYTFNTEIKTSKYGDRYAYAEIWKDGNLLYSGSNGGKTNEACVAECVRLYNKVKFNDGLIPLPK